MTGDERTATGGDRADPDSDLSADGDRSAGGDPAGLRAARDGDDGPARGAWVGVPVTWVVALAIGTSVGATVAVAVGLLSASGFAVAAVLVADGESDPVRAGAGTVLGAVALAGLVAAMATGPTATTLALSVAAFGAVAAPLDAAGNGRVVETLGVLTYGLLPLGIAAIGVLLAPTAGAAGGAVVDFARPGGPATALLTAAVLATVAAVALRSAVRAVPAVELAPRRDRDRVRTAVRHAESWLTRAVRVGLVGVLVGVVVAAFVVAGLLGGALADLLAATAGAGSVRSALLWGGVAGLVVAVAARGIRWAGETVLAGARRGAATAAGLALTVALATNANRALDAVVREAPWWSVRILLDVARVLGTRPTVLITASVLLLAAAFAALLLPAAVGLGIAPERALGPALSAAGLLCGTALAAGSIPSLLVFGGVAAAMVAWDVGEYAVGIGEEVGGHGSAAPEAVHAAGSLWTGAVAVALATGLLSLVGGGAPSTPTALAGLVAALFGVIVLVTLLRG